MTGRGYTSTRWNFFSTQRHRKEWRHKQKQTSDFDQAASAWRNKKLNDSDSDTGCFCPGVLLASRRDTLKQFWTEIAAGLQCRQLFISTLAQSIQWVYEWGGIGFCNSSRGQRIFTGSSQTIESLDTRVIAALTCKQSQAEFRKPYFLSHTFQFLRDNYYS